MIFYILGGVVIFLIIAVISISFVCFKMAFHVRTKDKKPAEEFPIPNGEIYETWRETMKKWMIQTRALKHEQFSIKSFDGLTLYAKYYEQNPGAPIEIMFHGYRGNAERDLCGGVQRCFALGHNAFIVDQRACGSSDGNVISFGINEYRDCLGWVDFAVKHFGPEAKFILTGISMGASTVLNAAGQPLPENVVGVLADCGYSSPSEIIKKVIADMKLPANIAYPFVQLGARLFGHFNLDEIAPVDAVKNCKLPVIFFHGEDDDFVPCQMSKQNFDACPSKKRLVTIPGAGHGLCYLVDPELYLQEMRSFFH